MVILYEPLQQLWEYRFGETVALDICGIFHEAVTTFVMETNDNSKKSIILIFISYLKRDVNVDSFEIPISQWGVNITLPFA